MEVALNLCWVLIALLSFCLWRGQSSCKSPGRQLLRAGSTCLLHLVCALTLLFPVISCSDNFLEEQESIEDSQAGVAITENEDAAPAKPTLRPQAVGRNQLPSGKHGIQQAATSICALRPRSGRLARWLVARKLGLPTLILATSHALRAPPSSQS